MSLATELWTDKEIFASTQCAAEAFQLAMVGALMCGCRWVAPKASGDSADGGAAGLCELDAGGCNSSIKANQAWRGLEGVDGALPRFCTLTD